MPNLINNDVTNNLTYFNYFDSLSNGVPLSTTDFSSLKSAVETRWGANTFSISNTNYFSAIPNSQKETLTNRTASDSNYRLKFPLLSKSAYNGGVVNTTVFLNSSTTASSVNISPTTATNNGYNNNAINSYCYGVIDNDCFISSNFATNGASLSTARWLFVASGWLKDSPFSDVRSLFNIGLASVDMSSWSYRPSISNSTTLQPFLTSGNAQYSITCASNTGDGTTPSANLWCTDLWLRDTGTEYAVGRIPHVLLAKGSGFTLGGLYYNATVIDGVTDQKIWLCCANYGTDKLLMRVWTEGVV